MITPEDIEQILTWINNAAAILIGAGAGLSVEAGNNYTDTKTFAMNYPGLVKKGFSMKLQLMGYENWTESEKWGYYAQHIDEVLSLPPHPIYEHLFEIVQSKDYFVITTNADELFPKSGFDPLRLYTPQGSYTRIQCLKPCTAETWSSRPVADNLLPFIDHSTQELTDPTVTPTCPNCGGPVFVNVRGGDWFVYAPYEEGEKRYHAWVNAHRKTSLLLLEIGAGFNTPVWIRWSFEQITAAFPGARLIRVNPDYPEIPEEIMSKSLPIRDNAGDFISNVWNGLGFSN